MRTCRLCDVLGILLHFVTFPPFRLLTYKPEGCKFGVELMSMDMETLNPGEFLNDKIMDFYLK